MATQHPDGAGESQLRKRLRLRVLASGALEVIDPDPGTIPLLRTFDPDFRVKSAPLAGFSRPRILSSRRIGSGIPAARLASTSSDLLWQALAETQSTPSNGVEASLLDVRLELASRLSSPCSLCHHRCGVDRRSGERGRCGLGMEAFVHEGYLHIAEEPPINPTFNLSLQGCGMRCRYCQQFDALAPGSGSPVRLEPELWSRIDLTDARALGFVGGNPTESLPAVLRFLRAVPESFALPIVWNCSGFDSVQAIRLLDGVVDVYVPDFKYGSERCAALLSDAAGYVANARSAVAEMASQGAHVLVRVLILPGHVDCCHLPSLDLLAPLRSRILLNVMAQYAPDFRVRAGEALLGRRPDQSEVARVRAAAQHRGFTFVGAEPHLDGVDGARALHRGTA